MSDEYKDRYIIITLLKTFLGTTDNIRHHSEFPYRTELERGSSSDRIKDLLNT